MPDIRMISGKMEAKKVRKPGIKRILCHPLYPRRVWTSYLTEMMFRFPGGM